MNTFRLLGVASALSLCLASGLLSAEVIVGGSAMLSQRNIVENAVNSTDHTTLVAAVKAAGLVSTLESAGPFTVFAPVNAAFTALPAGTVESLLKPENQSALANILTYHVVAGRYTTADLDKLIRKGNGSAELKTVSGGELTFMKNGPHNIVVKDETGATADITIYDVMQSNGVIYSIDRVLMPR